MASSLTSSSELLGSAAWAVALKLYSSFWSKTNFLKRIRHFTSEQCFILHRFSDSLSHESSCRDATCLRSLRAFCFQHCSFNPLNSIGPSANVSVPSALHPKHLEAETRDTHHSSLLCKEANNSKAESRKSKQSKKGTKQEGSKETPNTDVPQCAGASQSKPCN